MILNFILTILVYQAVPDFRNVERQSKTEKIKLTHTVRSPARPHGFLGIKIISQGASFKKEAQGESCLNGGLAWDNFSPISYLVVWSVWLHRHAIACLNFNLGKSYLHA